MDLGTYSHSHSQYPILDSIPFAGGDEDDQGSALDAGPTEDEPVDESEDERDAAPLALEEEEQPAEVDDVPAGENDLAEFRPVVAARSRSTNGATKGARKPRSRSKKDAGAQDGTAAKKPRARGGRSKKPAAASAAGEGSAAVGSAVVGSETTSAAAAAGERAPPGESGENGGETLGDSIEVGGTAKGRGRGRGGGRTAGRGRGRGRGGATGAVGSGGHASDSVDGNVGGASVGGEGGKRAAASDAVGPSAKARKLDAK